MKLLKWLVRNNYDFIVYFVMLAVLIALRSLI
jgi:hypothetical protein